MTKADLVSARAPRRSDRPDQRGDCRARRLAKRRHPAGLRGDRARRRRHCADHLVAAASAHPSAIGGRPLSSRGRSRLHAARRRRRRHRHRSVRRPCASAIACSVSPSGLRGAGALAACAEPAGGCGTGRRPLRAQSGRRGISKDAIHRGDVVLDPELHAPTDRIDARLRCCRRKTKPIGQWFPVRLHHASAEVGAHIVLLDDESDRARRDGRRATRARPADRGGACPTASSCATSRRNAPSAAASSSICAPRRESGARRSGRRSARRWRSPIRRPRSRRCWRRRPSRGISPASRATARLSGDRDGAAR